MFQKSVMAAAAAGSICLGLSATSLADVPPHVRAFCEGYAQTAQNMVKEALKYGCDYGGPRWDVDKTMHLNWCLGLKDLNVASNEENERRKGVSYCSTKRRACEEYTQKAVEQAKEAEKQKCGYTGPRWYYARDGHFNWCMAVGYSEGKAHTETLARDQGLKDCVALKQPTPAPAPGGGGGGQGGGGSGAKTVSVKKDVEVFGAKHGQGGLKGVLRAGNKVALVAPCSDNWCNVQGAAVPTGAGWAYDGPDYDSLSD